MISKPRMLLAACLGGVLAAGCSGPDDPHRRAKIGAGVGAVTGAVIGHQISHGSGKWVGAAVGALAGGAIGNYMDNQQRDFEQQLAAEREANQLEVERLRDDTLRLTLDSEVSFDFDSAAIKPAFRPSLDKLADVINKYNRTVVHVVGHTDSVGSAVYNQRLSERRAESVADYLGSRGVPYQRLRTEGRGKDEPRADNATEAGRQLNRRVEIYIKPIVEGQEQRAYESPRYP
jgi:outer membrane protein OmpA-like peptidoglycan-associated protein